MIDEQSFLPMHSEVAKDVKALPSLGGRQSSFQDLLQVNQCISYQIEHRCH